MTPTGPSVYQGTILVALQDRPMYLGTVSPKVKAARRGLNKRQKASRKANR